MHRHINKNKKITMKPSLFIFPLLALMLSCNNTSEIVHPQCDTLVIDSTPEVVVAEPQYMYGIAIDSLEIEKSKIEKGRNLSSILGSYNLDRQAQYKAEQAINSVYDVKKLKAGNTYCAMLEQQDSVQVLRHWVYEIDAISFLTVNFGDSITATKETRKIKRVDKTTEGIIETSLWNAIAEQGEHWELAMVLSDIYAWNIDFFGLQKGDMFKVYYSEKLVDDKFVGIDTIKCAIFQHNRHEYMAIPFIINGDMQYYDFNGMSVKKAFLKAPLKYSRISSTFSHSRFHPVLKIRRPHHGVDYAAPTGTPVMSIGDGTVTAKGYDKKGGGNYVRVQHNSTYSTVYMHLSKFGAISKGSHVKQGEVIGYVGRTGTATGPHLDFRVYKNGTPIDPLKLESPSASPVPTDSLDSYVVVRDSLLKKLQED